MTRCTEETKLYGHILKEGPILLKLVDVHVAKNREI